MSTEPTTVEQTLSQFSGFNQKTAIDVALKMLESPALYHSEIVNVPVMNAIKLQIMLCEAKGYKKSQQVWQTLYNALIDHMVAHKRKRATEIKDMFASLWAAFTQQQQEKKGLFNR